ncbi:MAG: YIP1 family protein [Actinomycetota bacterium]|nr:YIP1 family protein [Actinomycetota bacterium]
MFTRAIRAAMFDRKTFTEAFFDDDAAADGAIIVALVGALTYLGILAIHDGFGFFSVARLFQILIAAVASWLILAFATWFAATRLFGSTNRPQAMIAMHGLAALPLLLEIFGSWIAGLGLIWYLVVLTIATQEATDLQIRNAAVSVLIGFAVAAIVRALIGVPFAILGGIFG